MGRVPELGRRAPDLFFLSKAREAEEIEVLAWEEGGYRLLGRFAGDATVPSQVLQGLELKPAEVFKAAVEP